MAEAATVAIGQVERGSIGGGEAATSADGPVARGPSGGG